MKAIKKGLIPKLVSRTNIDLVKEFDLEKQNSNFIISYKIEERKWTKCIKQGPQGPLLCSEA